MIRSNTLIASCALCLLLASCVGSPAGNKISTPDEPIAASPEEEPQEEPVVPELSPDAEDFDPASISQDVFDSTKNDVQTLIERINGVIRDKDFDTWVSYLGNEYLEALSDKAFLKRASESSVLKKQKIVLRDLGDYFMYVVVPSRTKDRVDDIEFIGQNRVKAFTIDTKGRKLRLYDLEKTMGGWKIVN
jgi:hypothetical protein